MANEIFLNELNVGDCAVVCELSNPPHTKKRLQELGMIEGTVVECIGRAPGGELFAYVIRGAVIAIRTSDGSLIRVQPTTEKGE
ncbi:MAG: ferrous iron transport protein A [Ruminococcaceae bacterium]|nr:ferrous iron transport protein A [Oscillospiraceae bacterium]